MEDALLVKRSLSGDEESVRALVAKHQGVVFGLCLRMLRHRQDAEDTVQDVFLRMFRSLARWDSSRPFLPWLLQIAANRCRTHLGQRNKRPKPTELVDMVPAATEDDSRELGEELELALDTLRDEYRTCVVLFYQQELSLTDVAEIMETPAGTIKTWLHRARKEIADFLERRGAVADAVTQLHRI